MANNLKNFFETGITYAQLEEGCHQVTFSAFPEFVEHEKTPYVSFSLAFDDRIAKDNRFTEQSLNIMNAQLKAQLQIDGNISNAELYEAVMNADYINVWVSYNIKDGKRYRNFNYSAPLVQEPLIQATIENAEAIPESDLPF